MRAGTGWTFGTWDGGLGTVNPVTITIEGDRTVTAAFTPYGTKINFAGYEWWAKNSCDPVMPGPNYFSDSNQNVWVDPNGCLHLKIVQRDGRWYCSEVIADISEGYGTYVFTVQGRADLLDENIVLGLSTWEYCIPQCPYCETDIEFSRWGDANDPNNA